MDFFNSKSGLRGAHVLGPMHVVRANVALNYDDYTWNEELQEYIYAEIPGWVACLTEVHPWPYSEDVAGVPFDQSNLYGVRTRTWRQPLADGGGDMEWLTAVPKSLPAAYTAVQRDSILISGFYIDYLGGDPMTGVTWNHRTPAGVLLNDTTDPGGHRARWAPMNLNDQVLSSSVGGIYTGQWVYYGPDVSYDDPLYVVALIASDHIGFRGGKLTFTAVANYTGSASATYEIIAVRVDEYWDRWDADGTAGVVEVLDSGTLSWSFATLSDPPAVIEKTLAALLPADLGVRYNFFIRYAHGGFLPIYSTSHDFQLSPRTDVPLWYSASTGNRVAPGGILTPS